jgi:hypothetical protein
MIRILAIACGSGAAGCGAGFRGAGARGVDMMRRGVGLGAAGLPPPDPLNAASGLMLEPSLRRFAHSVRARPRLFSEVSNQ